MTDFWGVVRDLKTRAKNQRDDGLFEHRESTEIPGISFSFLPEKGVDGRVVLRNLTVRTKTVVERKPLEGVSLNVGQPIFDSETLETTIALRPDRYYGIQIISEKEGLLFVRLRVE